MDDITRILCVDDEKSILRCVQRAFMDDDYEIHLAQSGEEGLEILQNVNPIQIIISDYRMPGMDGMAFLKRVRENWDDTVRIVLSGYADMATIISAINEGEIYRFIPKPWNDEELRLAIGDALDRYRLQRENLRLAEELKGINRDLHESNAKLENLVEEKEQVVIFQERAQECSMNILDSLPVGVLGIDGDGIIVQCNQEALVLLGNDSFSPIGMDAEMLPGELYEIVAGTIQNGRDKREISLGGRLIRVQGKAIAVTLGQGGIILVMEAL